MHSLRALRQCARGAAAARGRALATDSAGAAAHAHAGLVEVREYELHPAGQAAFMALAAETAVLRARLLPLLGFFTCDTGGALNRAVHLYYYEDLGARDAVRRAAAADPTWRAYVAASRAHVAAQRSELFAAAAPALAAAGAAPVARFLDACAAAAAAAEPPAPGGAPPVFELRRYQLGLGYGAAPEATAALAAALPAKIAADGAGQLLYMAHTEFGPLNALLELWRYPSAAACAAGRVASRGVPVWRAAVAQVAPLAQRFDSALLHAAPFSPMR
jgi:hypothetical protein